MTDRKIEIRKAQADDAELVLKFVRKLAEYEHLEECVVASEGDLRKLLSGDAPLLGAHIVEVDGSPVGFCTYYKVCSTFAGKPRLYLEDIFVDPDCRGLGIGKMLFVAYAQEARKLGCDRLQWQVLDWNRPALDFYHSLGAVKSEAWVPYGVAVSDVLDD